MSMHSVCRSDELGVDQMKAFFVGGEKIALYHLSVGNVEVNVPAV